MSRRVAVPSRRRWSSLLSFWLSLAMLVQIWAGVSPAAASLQDTGGSPSGPVGSPVAPPPGSGGAVTPRTDGLYRALVTLADPQAGPRLAKLGVTVLNRATNQAIVVATRPQLARLGQLGYRPEHVNDVGDIVAAQEQVRPALAAAIKGARVASRGASGASDAAGVAAAPYVSADQAAIAALPAEALLDLAASGGVDSDNDGLTDTDEAMWCTDPHDAHTRGLQPTDGETVARLKQYLYQPELGDNRVGPPFRGWPVSPTSLACTDTDQDSIPDQVEEVLGLNPNRESTSGDKFDDGQKLFGITYCPGGSNSCGYGALPRNQDAAFVQSSLPGFVQWPARSPFVAAFPKIEIAADPSSIRVQAVTTITNSTGKTTTNGEEHTYGTAETKGTSDAITNTESWNDWQETSRTTADRSSRASGDGLLMAKAGAPSNAYDPSPEDLPGLRFDTNSGEQVGSEQRTIKTCAEAGADAHAGVGGNIGIVNGGLDAHASVSASGCTEKTYTNVDIERQHTLDVSISGNISPDTALGRFSVQYCDYDESQSSCLEKYKYATANNLYSSEVATQDQHSGATGSTAFGANSTIQGILDRISTLYPANPIPTKTETQGSSRGHSTATTHTEYQEYTTSQSDTEQFSVADSWETATTTDSSHAGDLTFTYNIANVGTDYAAVIDNISFNVQIGSDAKAINLPTAFLSTQEIGTLHNVFPGQSTSFTSRIGLTLDEMQAIDEGQPIFITLENVSYGADQTFYQSAVQGGMDVLVATVLADGVTERFGRYVVPVYPGDMVSDSLCRYFRCAKDSSGNLIGMGSYEYTGTVPKLADHRIGATTWWNIYSGGLGDSSAPLEQTTAAAGARMMIRFQQDSDLDGYSDRTENQAGTDPNDPTTHPAPQLIAGAKSSVSGNTASWTLAFLNNGDYDASGVQAVMYAPDGTISITNNTVGGGGRVRAGEGVVLGSRVQAPQLTKWPTSNADVFASGSYSGDVDATFTITANQSGTIGTSPMTFTWTDSRGQPGGTIDAGSSYHSPLPLTLRDGVQVAFGSGHVRAGDEFTVQGTTPGDTFKFTINQPNYTPPVVVVSYNDPQGNHRFVTTTRLGSLNDDLSGHASEMLYGLDAQILTSAPFHAGVNTINVVTSSPDSATVSSGKLDVNIVDEFGTIVRKQATTKDFLSGPTVTQVTVDTGQFSPAYQAGKEYTILAFWTDYQGNILGSRGRLTSTFAQDPLPIANLANGTYDFGSVTQGALVQQSFRLVNTGLSFMRLAATATGQTGLGVSNGLGVLTLPRGGAADLNVTLDTSLLPAGPVSKTLTVRTDDPNNQTKTITLTGTVTAASGSNSVSVFDAPDRPWDQIIRVNGDHPQFYSVPLTVNIQPDAATVQPCRLLSADRTSVLGSGFACADVVQAGTSPLNFGDGRLPDLVVTDNAFQFNPVRATANGSANGTTLGIGSATGGGFTASHIGETVMIHQTRGTGLGSWELNTIASVTPTQLTLSKPLANTYLTDGGSSRAQVLIVPQYRNVTIAAGVTAYAAPWDGSTGGILAWMANNSTSIQGRASAEARGYAGGAPKPPNGNNQPGQAYTGEGNVGPSLAQTAANGSGGGGGYTSGQFGGSGGGGSHAAFGGDGSQDNTSVAGRAATTITGTTDLSSMTFGGGGGGAAVDGSGTVGTGGYGGGIVLISSRTLTVSGSVSAQGGDGTSENYGGGGGGAGGSILLRGQNVTVNSGVSALYGRGGNYPGSGWSTRPGGNGGGGRIRIEYCDSLTGTPSTPTSTQQKTCSLLQRTDSTTTGPQQITLATPESITGGRNYQVQFGRVLTLTGAGSVTTFARITGSSLTSAKMDVLVPASVGSAPLNLGVDVGSDGTLEWQRSGAITPPATFTTPDLAAAFNAYLAAHPGTTDVPIRVTADRAATVILTNLAISRGASGELQLGNADFTVGAATVSDGDVLHLQATVHNTAGGQSPATSVGFFAAEYGKALKDAQLIGLGSLAPAAGTGTASFDWNTTGWSALPGGKATLFAVVDPAGTVAEATRTDDQGTGSVTVRTRTDLTLLTAATPPAAPPPPIVFSPAEPLAGDNVTLTATVRNLGQTDSPNGTPITVRFYDGDPSSGGTSIGQASIATTIAAGASQSASIIWTAPARGDHTVFAVVDDGGTILEGDETNNRVSALLRIGQATLTIDAGGANDTQYSAAAGFGWLDDAPRTGTNDFSAGIGQAAGSALGTARYDGTGSLRYQFDQLQPGHFYHLDAQIVQKGDTFAESVQVDGQQVGSPVSLVDATNVNQVQNVSVLIPPSAYADDRSIVVTFHREGSNGVALVNTLAVRPIDYRYVDAGGPDDLAYSQTRGYGYTSTSNAAGTGNALGTYRTSFDSTVGYRFDGLVPAKSYRVDVTMFDSPTSTRSQRVEVAGTGTVLCAAVPVFQEQHLQCALPAASYASGSVTINTVCVGCSGPRLNEIALEEVTLQSTQSPTFAAPVVTDPSTAFSINADAYTIRGTAQANALVKVWLDANRNGARDQDETTVVASQQLTQGATTFAIRVTLTQNEVNSFLVTATGGAGNESPVVAVPKITEDSFSPSSPTVSQPNGPLAITAASATIAGTAPADSLVEVWTDPNDNGILDPGEIDRAGSQQLSGGATGYSIPVALPISGRYDYLVTSRDAAGNASRTVNVPRITRTAPPGAPAVLDPGVTITVNAASYTVKGSAPAGSLVRVWQDANGNGTRDAGETTLLGSQQLGAAATDFSIAVTLTRNSLNQLLITATDAAGTESPAAPLRIQEDSRAPTIANLALSAPAIPPAGGSDTISYNVSELAAVTVSIKDTSGKTVRTLVNAQRQDPGDRTATWDGRGEGGAALGVGTYQVVVSAIDGARNQAPEASAPVLLGTDCAPRPNVTSHVTAGGGSLQVTVAAATSAATPSNALTAVHFTRLDNGSVTVPGRAPSTTPFDVSLSPAVQQLTFAVSRVTPGQATTVHLAIADHCGTWTTFVGGGTAVGGF
jgi:hypothetical protein